jgi:hypothetical protein
LSSRRDPLVPLPLPVLLRLSKNPVISTGAIQSLTVNSAAEKSEERSGEIRFSTHASSRPDVFVFSSLLVAETPKKPLFSDPPTIFLQFPQQNRMSSPKSS